MPHSCDDMIINDEKSSFSRMMFDIGTGRLEIIRWLLVDK